MTTNHLVIIVATVFHRILKRTSCILCYVHEKVLWLREDHLVTLKEYQLFRSPPPNKMNSSFWNASACLLVCMYVVKLLLTKTAIAW
jgi:hypothetical protein